MQMDTDSDNTSSAGQQELRMLGNADRLGEANEYTRLAAVVSPTATPPTSKLGLFECAHRTVTLLAATLAEHVDGVKGKNLDPQDEAVRHIRDEYLKLIQFDAMAFAEGKDKSLVPTMVLYVPADPAKFAPDLKGAPVSAPRSSVSVGRSPDGRHTSTPRANITAR